MHKKLVNYCSLKITITPEGPILIKSGQESADPTKPELEFIETYHQGGKTIYLPGSSLKGAIRAHSEKIIRSLGEDKRPKSPEKLWASNPVSDNFDYLKNETSQNKYRLSSFTDQLFGHVYLASRLRIEDAYPTDTKALKLEERNGIAIDRVFGSTIKGALFNYQVCTGGEFQTTIHLKNFTLPQLALIGLVLRDLNEGWFGIGFAKSRGMGSVKVKLNQATVTYPHCLLIDKTIKTIGSNKTWPNNYLIGVGEFLTPQEVADYGFPSDDAVETPIGAKPRELGIGVTLTWEGEEIVKDLFIKATKTWKRLLEGLAV